MLLYIGMCFCQFIGIPMWLILRSSSKHKTEPTSGQNVLNTFRFIDDLCTFNSNYWKDILAWLSGTWKREWTVKSPFCIFQLKAMKWNSPQSCLIKEISFSFPCCISIAKNHVKYFMLQLLLKFYFLPGQQQTWLIC